MASEREIDRLRSQARQRHRAATNKLSRLRAKGIDVSAAKLDPRRELAALKHMNSIQVRAYIRQLDKFTSRSTQFAPSATPSKPLSGNLWHTYKTLEDAVNRKNARPYTGVKDIFLPSVGMTVEGFQGMKPTHPVTGNPASRAPHLPIKKSSKGIPNDKQLRKLIKDMNKKLSSDYGDKVIKRDRSTALKLLGTIGEKSIIKDTKGLTPGQFAFMWNYTPFAESASQDYLIAQAHMHDPKALAGFHTTFDTQINTMKDIIKDVKKLDL